MSETPAGNASSASPGSPDRSPGAEDVPRLEPEPVLRMERTFSARREQVYAAWTESALLRRWSCPEDLAIGEAHSNLRVRGRFVVEVIEPESGEFFDEGPRTRMVLVQRGFPSVASRDGHQEGWASSFRKLDALLGRPEGPSTGTRW
jgi:uncharacterized protein YndB with AHSA1/START domain